MPNQCDMRPAVWFLVIVVALYAGCFLYYTSAAPAAYCPTYPCYGPCGQGCVCVTPPGEFSGECWGTQYVSHFLREGWRVCEE